MKMYSVLSFIAAFSATSAFAHGVEKIVPTDAHNFRLVSASLNQTETGETPSSDFDCGDNEQCPATPTYTTDLHVSVAYDSVTASQNPANNDSDFDENFQPAANAYFDLTSDQVATIKAKTLDPKSQVTFSVAPQQVQIQDPSQQYVCNYDSETNQKINDGCVEPTATMITVTRQVLTINFGQ